MYRISNENYSSNIHDIPQSPKYLNFQKEMSQPSTQSRKTNTTVLYVMASVVILLLILLFLEFQLRYRTDKAFDQDVKSLWLANDTLNHEMEKGFLELKDSIQTTQHQINSMESNLDKRFTGVDRRINKRFNLLEAQIQKIENQMHKPPPVQPGHNCNSPIATYYGIDFDHWSGSEITNLLRDDKRITFAIVKATGGDAYVNRNFREAWLVLKEKKMIRGAYHFFRTSALPVRAAEHYYSTVGPLGENEMAPIIDFEEKSISIGLKGQQNRTKVVSRFRETLDEVERLFGRKPIIYTNENMISKYLTDATFGEYKLWLADWTERESQPPGPWRGKGIFIWQKRGNVTYRHGNEQFDLDQFEGQVCDLWRD